MRTVNVVMLSLILNGCLILRSQEGVEYVQEKGVVHGSVLDVNGAAMALYQPIVVFNCGGVAEKTKVDSDGHYKIELPPSTCQVSVELNDVQPFSRAPISVIAGVSLMINLVVRERYLQRGISISEFEQVDKGNPDLQHEQIYLVNSSKTTLPLFIQFRRKRSIKNVVEFEDAMLTYDAIAVYADRIVVDKNNLIANAVGRRVVVEDGVKRMQVENAEIDFKGKVPVITKR